MSTRKSMHWIPIHTDGYDKEVIKVWKPPVIKIIDPSWQHIVDARAASPNSWFVLRDHPLSEQHEDMFLDPVGTGKRHAERWDQRLWELNADPERTWISGINEPHVWEKDGIPKTVDYTVSLMEEADRRGLQVSALEIGHGWPANLGEDLPVNWEPYDAIREVMMRTRRHVLEIHSYWDTRGPLFNWKWWAGRFTQCPWQVPIFIGECGIDQFVNGPGNSESRGWAAHMDSNAYMDQWHHLELEVSKDLRVWAWMIFSYDGAKPWGTLDIRQCRDKVLQYVERAGGTQIVHPWAFLTTQLTFGQALKAAAEAHDVISVNPDAALMKEGRRKNLLYTSNEFPFSFNGINYVCQRFMEPFSNVVTILFCITGQWEKVMSHSY